MIASGQADAGKLINVRRCCEPKDRTAGRGDPGARGHKQSRQQAVHAAGQLSHACHVLATVDLLLSAEASLVLWAVTLFSPLASSFMSYKPPLGHTSWLPDSSAAAGDRVVIQANARLAGRPAQSLSELQSVHTDLILPWALLCWRCPSGAGTAQLTAQRAEKVFPEQRC